MGGGGKKESSSETDYLGQYARALFNETSPLRKEFTDQSLEALKTGGIGAQIPLIARAIEASKAQTSQNLFTTFENLSKSRLAGTPFGQAIMAGSRIAGDQATARIPTDYAQSFISQIPGFIGAMTGTAVQGQSGAAANQTQLYNSYNQGYSNILSASIPGFQQMAGSMIGGAAGSFLPKPV